MKNLAIVPLYLIIIMVAIPQVSETIYVTSLPEIATSFGVSNNAVELTLTIYLIGFGFGVLLWGAVSDKFGRKPILLLGFFIYLLSCFGCYYSSSIELLLFFRFTQAFGASVGSVLGQAIARDTISEEERGRAFSIIGFGMSFAPAIGPVIGGYTIKYYHWSAVFIVLAIIALIAIFLIVKKLPETFIKSKEKKTFIINYISCIKQMSKDRVVLSFGFLVGSVNGILFGYFAESPFYFMESFNISSDVFGFLSFLICIPFLIGSALSKKDHQKKIYYIKIIEKGIFLVSIGSGIFFSLVYFDIVNISSPNRSMFLSYLCIFVCCIGVAMIIPNCLSNALQNYSKYTGTAASLFGFYYYLIVASMTFLMSYLHDGTLNQLPLFFVIQAILMKCVFYSVLKKINMGSGIK